MVTNQPEPQPRETPEDDMDDMYEEEPRRRAWGAIASVVLALALVFVGYQWNQTASRAEALGAQVNGLRAEAETQRLRAEDAQRQVDVIQKRLVAMSAEKDSLAERIAMLEKGGPGTSRGREGREAAGDEGHSRDAGSAGRHAGRHSLRDDEARALAAAGVTRPGRGRARRAAARFVPECRR